MRTPISKEELLALHSRSLEEHGGAPGVKDDPSRCISAALNACLYRTDGYDVLIFALSLFFCLVRGHNFVDGNKRVSWATLAVVLSTEGLSIEATDDEAESFVIKVAAGEVSSDEAEDWLLQRVVATDPI